MNIRLVQLDGKIPNLALMKLAHWHRARGDEITFTYSPQPSLMEPRHYDRVYGSAIFDYSAKRVAELRDAYPQAIIGGTGSGGPLDFTVEDLLGVAEYECYDYSICPAYPWSMGFTQRGCRLSCPFCVVPRKEGRPKPVNTIADIWRPGTERFVVLLDNDFFGQPKADWQARLDELVRGGYRVCFSQGINIRLVDKEAAAALAQVKYYDDQFRVRRLYTAWDNLRDEAIFFRGLDRLDAAGIPPKRLMVYMLIGFAQGETTRHIRYRFNKLVEAGCKPYPMPFDQTNREHKAFQRWAVRRYHQFIPWERFKWTG